MLPGCGSAWKKPSISSCLTIARSAFLGQRLAVQPGLVDGCQVADLDPADELHGQTRSVEYCGKTWGMCTPGIDAMFSVSRKAL
jgi:hypothetical protein